MYELPLFPLNTVLFPGMPLPLHVFEDRYMELIQFCLAENEPFGVVLIDDGAAEGIEPAQPHMVGCTAEIAQVEPLDDGRMLIMSIGRERFRIKELDFTKPYIIGLVESAPLQIDNEAAVDQGIEKLTPLLRNYLEMLSRTGSVEFDPTQIPRDPVPLIYLAATLIQLPTDDKQQLLSLNRASKLLHTLSAVYSQEVGLMRWMPSEDQGLFSVN